MKLSPTELNRVRELRTSMMIDAALGHHKNFKTASKEYASLAVRDFDTVKKLPAQKISVPLFSKAGMNMLYVRICELFRIKTPDEKLLRKMGKEELTKRKLNLQG